MNLPHLLNYGTIALTVGLPAIGVALGQGLAGISALQAITIQPSVRNDITKTVILGMALMETAAVISIGIAIVLLFDPSIKENLLPAALGRLGIALAICLPGLTIGLVSSWPTQKACYAIARQPFFSQKILNLLLITQSILQTPVIFGFIISWFIKTQAASATTIIEGLRLLSSGFVIGCGSIGPAIGLALFAQTALEGIGKNRKAYTKMVTFTFISEAVIETPILFSFIVGLLMLFNPTSAKDTFVRGVIMLAAATCTGIGTIVPSINSGVIASAAGKEIALHPEHYPSLVRTSMFSQALMDTFVIYASLISLLMLVLVR